MLTSHLGDTSIQKQRQYDLNNFSPEHNYPDNTELLSPDFCNYLEDAGVHQGSLDP